MLHILCFKTYAIIKTHKKTNEKKNARREKRAKKRETKKDESLWQECFSIKRNPKRAEKKLIDRNFLPC